MREPGDENGRRRFHGGASTGSKTAAGKTAQRAATTKHGFRGQLGRVMDEIKLIVFANTLPLAERAAERRSGSVSSTVRVRPSQTATAEAR